MDLPPYTFLMGQSQNTPFLPVVNAIRAHFAQVLHFEQRRIVGDELTVYYLKLIQKVVYSSQFKKGGY